MIPVSSAGPHGVDVDEERNMAYIACDGGAVVAVDLNARMEVGKVAINPNPDVAWLNISTGLLYCAVSKPGLIEVIDTSKMKVVEQVPTEEGCHTFAFSQENQTLQAYLNRSCKLDVYQEK